MASLNKVMLIGNIGKMEEVKTLNGGDKLLNFSLATSRKWKDSNGKSVEKTEWHNITAWKHNANYLSSYANCGDLLHIEGSIEYSQYTNKEGGAVYSTKIVAQNVLILKSKNSQNKAFSTQEDSIPFQ